MKRLMERAKPFPPRPPPRPPRQGSAILSSSPPPTVRPLSSPPLRLPQSAPSCLFPVCPCFLSDHRLLCALSPQCSCPWAPPLRAVGWLASCLGGSLQAKAKRPVRQLSVTSLRPPPAGALSPQCSCRCRCAPPHPQRWLDRCVIGKRTGRLKAKAPASLGGCSEVRRR